MGRPGARSGAAQGGVGSKHRAGGTDVRGSSSRDVAAELYGHEHHLISSSCCSPGP